MWGQIYVFVYVSGLVETNASIPARARARVCVERQAHYSRVCAQRITWPVLPESISFALDDIPDYPRYCQITLNAERRLKVIFTILVIDDVL